MALSNSTQNILRTQYYDDWFAASNLEFAVTQGENFDFHRMLFRPKFPVQSRELTQLQTLLQHQLERLGQSSFRDGEAVLGGQLTLDTSVSSGQVLPTSNLVAMFDRADNRGKFIFDKVTPTTRAHVLQFLSSDEGETSNSYVFFKLQTATAFAPSSIVQASDDTSVTATFASGSTADIFSAASVCSIDAGVFFVSGFFVRIHPQTIVLSPFTNLPSFRIGLEIHEEILDELDDVVGTTLLDPANANAPGAHRFRLALNLGKRSLDTAADANFIELARVVDGQVLQSKITPKFVRLDELNQILARRTYDEAGDYIVSPFTPVIDVNPADEGTFMLALGPGKAYVQGFEIQTTEPVNKVIRKGRATANATNRSLPTSVGNFVYVDRVAASQPTNYFANTATVDLHVVNVASINTASNAVYQQSKVGTAKVRMLETFEVPPDPLIQANNSIYKLFFYDVNFDSLTGNVVAATQNGDVITLELAPGRGLPVVNAAISNVTIVLSGASSPVTGTFTVNTFTANSTDTYVALAEFLPTLPNGNTQYKLLFQTQDVDSFALLDTSLSSITAPYAIKLAFQADVDVNSKLGAVPSGKTIVLDTNDNVLLYQIPETFIKANSITSNTATWATWEKTSTNAHTFAGVSNDNITLTVSGNNYGIPVGSLSATTAAGLFIVFDQTNDANGHGRIIQFADAPAANTRALSNVTVTQVGQDYNILFTYHHGDVTSTTRSFVGLAKTTVSGMPVRQKTLHLGNTSSIVSNTTGAQSGGQIEFYSLNATAGFTYSLKTTDVFRIGKILYKNANTAFVDADLTTATDVTSLFTLDTGQRDNTYEYSVLIANPNASSVIRPNGRLLVIFDWFQHSGRGYASIDSYLSSQNIAKGMTYDIVPDYVSTKFGNLVSLRDVLDFRPVRSTHEWVAAPLVFSADDASTNTTYLTSTTESYLLPVSNDVWLGSYQYYLARIDKVGLFADGTFKVIEGTDAVTPVTPADTTGCLLLYQLQIPPYTLVDANGVPLSVSLQTFNYKRYAMRDIAVLDNRVAHLEYYTSLNSLEQITSNQNIPDAQGVDRFKNGIIVDTFLGATVADIARPDYTAAIDTMKQELHVAFETFVLQFSPDTSNATSFNVALVGDMAILAYNTAPFVTQPLATHAISVNPFDVASFYGLVSLLPAVDIWKDTDELPAQVVDLGGPSAGWINAEKPSFTNWGEWDTTFSGVTASDTQNAFFTPPGWTPTNHAVGSMTDLSWNDVTTSTTKQRQGTAYDFTVQSSTASIGNVIRDTSVVHNIRARDVIFAGTGLKPDANIFPFFDGTSVINFIQKGNTLQLPNLVLTNTAPFYLGQTLYVQKALSGTVATTNGLATIVGTNSAWVFELLPGTLVRITQGVNSFDSYIGAVAGVGSATLIANAGISLANAVISSLTPVSVADIAPRITGGTVQYTLKVVRAKRDVDGDAAIPYAIVAGSLRPDKQVNDAGTSTVGATLLIPPSPRGNAVLQTMNIVSAVCVSGVVRSYTPSTGALRFDLDITDSAVATHGTPIFFVAGPGAGQQTTVLSYNAAIQTAVVDTSSLTNIVAGQSIYSVGQPSTDGFVTNTSVTSGRAGTIAGVFHIPNAQFAVGSRLFRLTDSATNNIQEATATAELSYTASGLSVTQQDVSVSSRYLDLQRGGPQTESMTTQDSTVSGFNIQYVDPLAETFLVDAVVFPQGVFVASVDLCFASVPDDDIPVIVELRAVINGYPSSNQIIPCVSSGGLARVTKRPDQVNVSATPDFGLPSATTTFVFDSPVYLMPGQEYALVVRSDSDTYTVYTAELGASIIGSDAKVAKQPYAGSFFKSQNASTWTESPFEDLMFRLNKAVWDASAAAPLTGALIGRGIAPAGNLAFDSLEFYPHDVNFSEATSSLFQLDIKPLNLATNDLTGQVATRYSVIPNSWGPLAARSMIQGYGGGNAANNVLGRTYPFGGPTIGPANTIDVLMSFTTKSADVAPYVDLKKINALCVQHNINNMGVGSADVVIQNPGSGYLPVLQNANGGLLTTNAGDPVVVGTNTHFLLTIAQGSTVVVGGNLEIVVASVTNNTQFVASANVTITRTANDYWTYGNVGDNNAIALTFTDGVGSGAGGYAVIGPDGHVNNIVITSQGSGYTGTPLIVAPHAVFGTGDFTIVQANTALLLNSELYPTFGNGLTRYIQRAVPLADGFDASDLTVYFDAYRPLGSHFYVYYKVLGTDMDTARFDDQPWRLMKMATAENVICTSYNQFKEFEFITPNGRALDQPTDSTNRFKVFAFKIVMAGISTTDVPRIQNFRGIALDQ